MDLQKISQSAFWNIHIFYFHEVQVIEFSHFLDNQPCFAYNF